MAAALLLVCFSVLFDDTGARAWHDMDGLYEKGKSRIVWDAEGAGRLRANVIHGFCVYDEIVYL